MISTSNRQSRNPTASQPGVDMTTAVCEAQVRSPERKHPGRYWKMALPFLLVLLTIAVYANGLNGEFVFDDEPSIVHNPDIRTFGTIFNRLGNQEARPVVFASLALNYRLGELKLVPDILILFFACSRRSNADENCCSVQLGWPRRYQVLRNEP
jgi:hypothetical protein